MAERNITISLMRAYFNAGFNNTAENVLISAFQKLENTSDRVVAIDFFRSHLFAHSEKCSTTDGTFIRVLEFENGAIGVIDLANSDGATIVKEFVHPNKKDFLKQEIVFLCVENYILACNIGKQRRAMSNSILNFAVKADVVSEDVMMEIAVVPDHATIQDLNDTGVKSIDFDVTDFIQNLDVSTQGTAGQRIMEYIWADVSGATSKRRLAATTAKLVLHRGRIKKRRGST